MERDDIFDDLERNLGTDAANRLVDLYSGSNLYIPQSIGIKRKHRQIRDEFKNGAGYKELARRFGYTERRIRQIIHDLNY